MKAGRECYSCLKRLINQAVDLATDDPDLRSKAKEGGVQVLDRRFSTNVIPAEVASEIHRVVRKITGNPDPYRERKDQEMDAARKLWKEIEKYYGRDFRSCVSLSVLGNTIDFFRDLTEVKRDMRKPVEFEVDGIAKVEGKLEHANKVLYLADNAAEVFFDVPLIEKMREYDLEVIYVVKGGPVQNDITLEDLRRVGLEKQLRSVITTGASTVGIDFSRASAEFKREFNLADLIFAKGMGYYETLSELPIYEKIFYILMAKCKPVANSLMVPINSYVAMLQ